MIQIEHLAAGYGGEDVIRDLNLTVTDGENLSIIGPNGCGKTTLLRCMAGVLPFAGSILLDGVSVSAMRGKTLAKKIAMLSQLSNIAFNYTVMETVLMGRFAHAAGIFSAITKHDREIAARALVTVGMQNEAERSVTELSGGQLQRVFLAKVLAQEPEIILLDEPTNHLDLRYQVELIEFLRDWAKRESRTVIGVLHDMNLAAALSDRLLLMQDGKVLGIGPAKEVLLSDKMREAYHMDVGAYMQKNLALWSL